MVEEKVMVVVVWKGEGQEEEMGEEEERVGSTLLRKTTRDGRSQ